jgi:hypothetical protein
MKKILAVATAIIMITAVCATVSFAASEPALIITAEQLSAADNTYNGSSAELKEEGGEKFAQFTAVNLDPHFYFGTVPETDAANHYAVVKYRTTSGAQSIDAYMAGAEPHTIFGTFEADGQWHCTIGDLEQSGSNWTGKFARLDPLNNGGLVEGDTIDIAWIALFASEDDAKAYTGGSSEQQQPAEKGEDQWLCGEEPAAMSPNWWFNPVGEPDDKFVTVTFTATSNFSGIHAFYYCSNTDNGFTLAHMNVALVKDGNVVADAELASNGDAWADTDFGKVFGPGEYTIRYTPKSGSGVENDCWCVLAGTTAESSAVVEAGGGARQSAEAAPVIMLIGADAQGTTPTNPGTADASVIAIAAVACVALAGVVIAKKVR